MKLKLLSDSKQLVICGTLCLAMLPMMYPRTTNHARNSEDKLLSDPRTGTRLFIWNFETNRPDIGRMAVETSVVLIIGLGLAIGLGERIPRKTDILKSDLWPSITEPPIDRQISLWILDDALEIVRQSSFWSAAQLEGRLVITESDVGEKKYETQEYIAIQLLQWSNSIISGFAKQLVAKKLRLI